MKMRAWLWAWTWTSRLQPQVTSGITALAVVVAGASNASAGIEFDYDATNSDLATELDGWVNNSTTGYDDDYVLDYHIDGTPATAHAQLSTMAGSAEINTASSVLVSDDDPEARLDASLTADVTSSGDAAGEVTPTIGSDPVGGGATSYWDVDSTTDLDGTDVFLEGVLVIDVAGGGDQYFDNLAEWQMSWVKGGVPTQFFTATLQVSPRYNSNTLSGETLDGWFGDSVDSSDDHFEIPFKITADGSYYDGIDTEIGDRLKVVHRTKLDVAGSSGGASDSSIEWTVVIQEP